MLGRKGPKQGRRRAERATHHDRIQMMDGPERPRWINSQKANVLIYSSWEVLESDT